MVRVKQAFGVFILGTALYYGYLAYGLFANRWVDPGAVSASVEEQLKAGWHASLDEGLAVAAREQDAGAHRLLGHLVQELPDDGQDDAGGCVGEDRAGRLHEDQGPGRRPR